MKRLAPHMLSAVALLVAGGCHSGRTMSARVAAPAAAPSMPPSMPSPKLLTDLALLAIGERPEPATLDAALADFAAGRLTLEGYVDGLLANPRFAHRIAPQMLLNELDRPAANNPAPRYVLKHTRVGQTDVYHLRAPCRVEEAVQVKPWWSPENAIAVCPDSYQPDHLLEASTGRYCGAGQGGLDPDLSTYCGCGPDMIFCLRDGAHMGQMGHSLQTESEETIAYVVERSMPLRELFLMNGTVRDGLAQFQYDRWRYMNGALDRIPDPRAWGKPHFAPREELAPGLHAGLLTTPHFLYMTDGPRDRIRIYYDKLWCKPPDSVHVETEVIFALNTGNLRNGLGGGDRLAKMPICTSCHARLDFGLRFFGGFGMAHDALWYEPKRHLEGSGPLYGNDINDPRGSGVLTPHGFAELALAQREFTECMVSDVSHHVFHGEAEPEDTKALMAEFERTGKLRELVRLALLRYAQREQRTGASAALPVAASPAPARDAAEIPVPPTLRSAIDTYCIDCHEDGPRGFLKPAVLSRELLERMLSQVAFGTMPRGGFGLPAHDREAFVEQLLALLWPDEDARRVARQSFQRSSLTSPVHRFTAVRRSIQQLAQAEATPLPFVVEAFVSPENNRYTPGLAGLVAIEALDACKQHGRTGDELRKCIERASAPPLFVNGATHPAASTRP